MNPTLEPPPIPLLSGTDLEAVLDAWQGATIQLEQTHRLLRDEVRRLTDELAVKNRELARKNRLADLGQMASHIAHEVRNNLVPVSLYASLLRRRLHDDEPSAELLGKIETGLSALDVMVHDLLHFTSDREPRVVVCPVVEVLDEVLDSLEPQLAAQAITVCRLEPSGLELWADRDMVRRALLNLVLNALDAMPNGGTLTTSAGVEPDAIILDIADTGAGVSDDVERRAFEPFFTTKSTGTGLGLAIVHRVVEVHGGSCLLTNRLGGGAVVTLRWPRVARGEAAA